MRVLFAIAHLDKGGGQAVQATRLISRLGPLVGGELLCLQANGSAPSSPSVAGTTVVGHLAFPSGVRDLRRAIVARRPEFDLIQVFDPYYSLPAAQLAHGPPIVVRLGTHPVEDLGIRYGFPGRMAMRMINPWLYHDTTIVVNAHHLLSAFPPGRAHCIPNGVDVDRFPSSPDRPAARAELGLPPEVPLVAFTGKIVPRKNIEDLYWLIRAVPELHLLLVGTDQEPYYGDQHHRELRAAYQDVLPRVHAVGEVPLDRVPRYLEAADIFVFPSRFEGMPNSALEAMATSLPIVAFDSPAHREILDPDAGLLYSTRPQLAEAVRSLVVDSALRQRIGSRARARVAAEFSLDRAVQSYLELYRTILSKGHSGV